MIEHYCPDVATFIASVRAQAQFNIVVWWVAAVVVVLVWGLWLRTCMKTKWVDAGAILVLVLCTIVTSVLCCLSVYYLPGWMNDYYFPQASLYSDDLPACLKQQQEDAKQGRINALEAANAQIRYERERLRDWADYTWSRYPYITKPPAPTKFDGTDP